MATIDGNRIADLERQFEAHRQETKDQLSDMQGELEVLDRNDRNAATAFGELRGEVAAVKAQVAKIDGDVRVMASELSLGMTAIKTQIATLSDNVQIPAKYLWPLVLALFGGSILGAGGARDALADVAGTPPAVHAPPPTSGP